MAPGVHVERIEVAALGRAPRRCAEVALSHRGGARTTLVLAVGLAERPGLRVAPWTLHAAVTTARARPGLVVADTAGRHDASVVRRQLDALGLPAPGQDAVQLLVPGVRQSVRIPSAWIGAHACLLIPCVYDARVGTGPAQTALAAIATACTRESLRDPVAAGRWLVEHVFASAGVMLDATWSARVDDGGEHLRSTDRIAASAAWQAAALDVVAASWTANGAVPGGLAARRVEGLWRKDPHRAHVPGALAQSWHAYSRGDGESSV